MPDDRETSAGTGVLVATIVVVLLLACGGGALLLAGGIFLFRAAPPRAAAPPPAVSAVPAQPIEADVLAIADDGELFWNDAPITSGELRQRLEGLKHASGPPRPVIVRSAAAAPPAARDEVVQLLNDRGISFISDQPE